MRSAYLFAMIAGAGSVTASAVAFAVDLPVYPITIAYAGGVVFSIAASVVVNTRNAAQYGREVWEDQGGMDGFNAEHYKHMRRDRVRRHPEAPATFPAGDVA